MTTTLSKYCADTLIITILWNCYFNIHLTWSLNGTIEL